MKKHLIILLFLLASLASHAQSDAYLRFAPNPNLDVAFVEAFRLDDTTTVDITVIIAKDSATLFWMIEEFNLTEIYNHAVSRQKHLNPRYLIARQVSKADPSCRVTKLVDGEYDLMSFSIFYKRIILFHIQNAQQRKSVMGYSFRSITTKHKQQ